MLYLCLAMVVDVAIFTMGLTMSIIDVNKYNFGLYLVLISVVAFSLLAALWVAKPKFCQTPQWAVNVYQNVKSSKVDHVSHFELEVSSGKSGINLKYSCRTSGDLQERLVVALCDINVRYSIIFAPLMHYSTILPSYKLVYITMQISIKQIGIVLLTLILL